MDYHYTVKDSTAIPNQNIPVCCWPLRKPNSEVVGATSGGRECRQYVVQRDRPICRRTPGWFLSAHASGSVVAFTTASINTSPATLQSPDPLNGVSRKVRLKRKSRSMPLLDPRFFKVPTRTNT